MLRGSRLLHRGSRDEALIQEGDSNLQIGAALYLAASIEAATDPESEAIEANLKPKPLSSIQRHSSTISEKRNEVSSADLFAGSLRRISRRSVSATPSHSSPVQPFLFDLFPGTLAGIQHKSDMFLLGICEVWHGPCVFPDYTNSKARSWWANLVKEFVSNGVDGIWNDMNEPAVFKVYGMLMARSTYEGMELADKNKRPFVLTRAGFIGSQRYAATWTGDNLSNWEHLHMSISMVLQLGLSGQPLSGPDIGGFAGNATPRLFGHWMGVGAMFPFCHGHSEAGTDDHEPWSFGEEIDAVVYLVDAYDKERFAESKKELDALLSDESLANVPFLVLGNKLDIPYAASEDELRYNVGLTNFTTGKGKVNLA
ncbi:unnamed protein product [Arabidopsis arenosa]|uniref:Glycoside hydrolase family 31 TIM barrel domain-containing protein n=1 Tax=Arabidopsis arenosa TaxID=38785 RepID=A0A8S2A8V1_ARAAE|nr:unnamed protein product [Arabidopsis arenosa]